MTYGSGELTGYSGVSLLGTGATGVVRVMRHDATERLVAVKFLAPSLADAPAFRERFRREAEILERLRHPHIAGLLWYVEDNTGAAIAMELVEGVELRHLIRGGIATPEAALLVLRGSLDALEHAHQAGVVHRDYKPGNVLVDAQGTSRLIDFGIAARVGETGIVEGTPKYAAPEQWRGAAATPATDVYACAAVLHECLTGRVPYDAPDMPRLAILHATAPIPVEDVPPALHPLLLRGLAKTAAERYPSAGAFRDDLERVASDTYGSAWAEHGRRALAGLALGAAALFPLHGVLAATTTPAASAPATTATVLTSSPTAGGTAVASTSPATTGILGGWLAVVVGALVIAGATGVVAIKTSAFGLRSSGSSAVPTARPASHPQTQPSGGAGGTLNVDRPGDVARFTFAGTTGQKVFVDVPASTVPDECGDLTLQGPDGAKLSSGCIIGGTGFIDATVLPATGTYTVVVAPTRGPGTTQVRVFTSIDQQSTIAVGGPEVTATIAQPGAVARLSFSGVAGQKVFVDVPSSTIPNECGILTLTGPDGTRVSQGCIISGKGFIDATVLPATGQYTIIVDPASRGTGSAQVGLIAAVDQQGAIALDGPDVTARIAQPGAVARFTFSGTAGQTVVVEVPSSTLPDECGILTLEAPDHTRLNTGCIIGGTGSIKATVLPASGEYTIVVDPQARGTGDAQLRLHS